MVAKKPGTRLPSHSQEGAEQIPKPGVDPLLLVREGTNGTRPWGASQRTEARLEAQ